MNLTPGQLKDLAEKIMEWLPHPNTIGSEGMDKGRVYYSYTFHSFTCYKNVCDTWFGNDWNPCKNELSALDLLLHLPNYYRLLVFEGGSDCQMDTESFCRRVCAAALCHIAGTYRN